MYEYYYSDTTTTQVCLGYVSLGCHRALLGIHSVDEGQLSAICLVCSAHHIFTCVCVYVQVWKSCHVTISASVFLEHFHFY